MIRGLYTAAAGMAGEQLRLDVVANNLANADTPGFKRDVAVFHSFQELLIARLEDGTRPAPGAQSASASFGAAAPLPPLPVSQRFLSAAHGAGTAQRQTTLGMLGSGSYVDDVWTVHAGGNHQRTDNPLDLALEGPGFFVLDTPQGQRYVRTLSLSPERGLVTGEGYAVMGQFGPLPDFPGDWRIDEQGTVWLDGEVFDFLQIVDFADRDGLQKIGQTVFAATDASGQPQPIAEPLVRPGYLERSNINPVSEMVQLINIMRAYEASQKAIQVQDQTLDRAANDIGRVG